jgi:hypothetical protein
VTARSSLSFAPASRVWRIVALAAAVVGALAVAGTHFTFSNTVDEPAHIAAGVQWLAGKPEYDEHHPPLARIVAGIAPFLRGDRGTGAAVAGEEGARILGRGAHYRTTLALARLGELPFFFLLCGLGWAWGRRLTDERGAAIATLLIACNPDVIAHAGLATTDIAVAATITGALFAFSLWLDEPRWPVSLALGVALGLSATADYSALPMLALALPTIYALHRWAFPTSPPGALHSTRLATCLMVCAATLTGWALYRFHAGAISEGSWLLLPAPGWFRGLAAYAYDLASGHPAYLLGVRSANGWWYYYAIALLVKTPLPLLLLTVLGAVASIRDLVRRKSISRALPFAGALAIITALSISGDDSGIRLVLPVFALFAIIGSTAIVELWDTSARTLPAKRLVRAAVAAILVAAVLIPARTHPDHLAYFNPIAGDRPELVLVDSNLDWGQDLYRLGAVMKRMHIDSVAVAYYGSASLDAAGVRNGRFLSAAERPTGWIVASQTMLAGVGGDGAYEWLNEIQPVGRVGQSLVLYYVPTRTSRR